MKYLKMVGFLLAYFAIPALSGAAIVLPLREMEPFKTIVQHTYTFLFGITDPISILLLVLFVKYIKKKEPMAYGNFKKIDFSTGLIAAVLGIIMSIFTFAILNIEYIKTHFWQLGSCVYYFIAGNVFLMTYVIIVNSIYKEFCFRGLYYNELRAHMPVVAAIIVQAALYAAQVLIYMHFVVALYGFLGACIFGLIFYYGRSVWASIIAQISTSMGLMAIDKLGKGIFTSQNAGFILALTIVSMVILLMMMYKNYKNQADNRTIHNATV